MIDKLTPRYLETSKDNKLKEAYELIDALNVTVTGDTEGGQGVVKNIKGTEPVAASNGVAPVSGVNKCIGSVRDEALGVVYFFVYNSQGNHGVYAYSAKTNTYRLIFMDSSLDFQENGFVKADVVRTKRRHEDEEIIILDDAVTPGPVTGEPEEPEEPVGPAVDDEDILEDFTDVDSVDEPDTPVDGGSGIEVPTDAEPPALELLIFTGNFCDYPDLADVNGNITNASILDAGTHVNQLITNGTLTPVEATHQFPYMTLNGIGFTSSDIGLALDYLLDSGGSVFCENLVEPA